MARGVGTVSSWLLLTSTLVESPVKGSSPTWRWECLFSAALATDSRRRCWDGCDNSDDLTVIIYLSDAWQVSNLPLDSF